MLSLPWDHEILQLIGRNTSALHDCMHLPFTFMCAIAEEKISKNCKLTFGSFRPASRAIGVQEFITFQFIPPSPIHVSYQ